MMRRLIILVILIMPHLLTAEEKWTQQSSPNFNDLWSVFFCNADTGYAVGGRTIIKTTDGGQHWKAQSTDVATVFYCVCFTHPDTGWISGRGGNILHTVDGGENWTKQNSGVPSDRALPGIHFFNSTTGWVAGSNGTILHTSDSGEKWNSQTSGTNQNLITIYFADANNGWAVGYYGTIIHTSDGGENWTTQESGTDKILSFVRFTSTRTGYAAGEGGTILKTSNGGKTWGKLITGTGDWLYNLYFLSSMRGWVVGRNGTIMYTGDGGSSWMFHSGGTDKTIMGVYFVDSRTGWAVGAEGTILHYSTVTSVTESENIKIPSEYVLSQNYPNPFNPTTLINYRIRKAGNVTLEIYNVSGQLIRVLLQEAQPEGTHSVVWDGRNSSGLTVPSGVYLYRLRAGDFVSTKKMLFLK